MKTLFLYEDGQTINKAGEKIEVMKGNAVSLSEPVMNISDILIMGNIQITAQALKLLAKNSINITYATKSGKIYAFTNSMSSDRCTLRIVQYELFSDNNFRLSMAKMFCRRKINLQVDYLKNEKRKLKKVYIKQMEYILEKLDRYSSVNGVLGVEGQAANMYFAALSKISIFTFRTRRPAVDIYNALLNLTYMMLLNRINSVLFSKGLDTQLGFLHSIKSGRASLSLDFLELFRTKADKFVTTITNRREFTQKDFDVDEETHGFYLNKQAFSKYIAKYSEAFNINGEIERECNMFIIALKNRDVSIFEQA